jgi:HEAT repeat protein
VRRAAALALARHGRDRASRLFLPGLKDDDWFVRFASAKGLAALDPAVALQVIHEVQGEGRLGSNVWVSRVIGRIVGGRVTEGGTED